MNRQSLVVFTGGHHNSALVVAKLLKKKGVSILWLGHRHSTANKKYISEEYKEVVEEKIRFINLKSGKIHKGNIIEWLKFIKSIFFCFRLFIKKRPNLIVSFGGYLSVPTILAGWLLNIPSISHEQTATLGMANRATLPFVKKMFLTWPELKNKIHSRKIEVIGLPIKNKIIKPITKTQLNKYFNNLDKPLILISGGKQGSHIINKFIEKNLTTLLDKYNIFHQAGNNPTYNDFKRLEKLKLTLNPNQQHSYQVFGYINNINKYIKTADIIVGRSGAHTIYDILLMKKKMIAIPLKFAYANEQYKNALKLVNVGLADILVEDNLTIETFIQKIDKIITKDIDKSLINNYIKENLPSNAGTRMVNFIEKYLQ